MKRFALLTLTTFSVLAHPKSLFTHLDDGHFMYRGHRIHFNVHASKLLRELARNPAGEFDTDIADAMGWPDSQVVDLVQRLIGNINHRSLYMTGAPLLRHDPKLRKQPMVNRVELDLSEPPTALQAGERVQALFAKPSGASTTELLVTETEFRAIGLPIEDLRREINKRLSAGLPFQSLTIELVRNVHRASFNGVSFGAFTPQLMADDCSDLVK